MGWETTPLTIGLFMETIKLERNGKVIERTKADYDMNKSAYDIRGFKEYTEKPKTEPKPKAENLKKNPKKIVSGKKKNLRKQKQKRLNNGYNFI